MKIEDFIRQNENWKDVLQKPPYNIIISENDDYFLLKYNQIASDFNNELVRQCRGIIFDKGSLEVVCRPFDKFGNYGESYVPDIDWPTARVQEKVDGSIIKLWYHKEWRVSTNGSINAFETDLPFSYGQFKTFGDAFMASIDDEILFDELDREYTYMFELVGPYNRVVVPYENLGAYHIGTRHTKTGEEAMVDIGIQRPKEYDLSSLEEVVAVAAELPYNEEGYVVVDGKWNRIKVKSPAYLAIHRLRGEGAVSPRRAIAVILMNEHSEFLNYFPEYKEFFDEVEDKLDEFKSELKSDIAAAAERKDESRKDFALWAKNTRMPSILFQWLDGKVESVDEWLRQQDEKKIEVWLGYK